MRIAINGFGRIGRAVFKLCLERDVDVVAINDVHGIQDAAYLLQYDSVYGKYEKKIVINKNTLVIDGKPITVLNQRDPKKLPWKKLHIDLVVESTGIFTSKEKASMHLKAGAKKVIVSAPFKGKGKMVVPGVNENQLKKSDKVISTASCTTNCLAPIAKIINEHFGIKHAFMTTDHAYTASQLVVDGSHKERRRGRSAALNIIPTTTGANKAVERIIPQLKGKMKGIAMRVPVASGSIIDLVAETKKQVTTKKVNVVLKKVSQNELRGILEYSEDELVSSDIIGNLHAGVIDGLSTEVNGKLVKILAWYDNEYGYASNLVNIIKKIEAM